MMRVQMTAVAALVAVWSAAAPAATIDVGSASGMAGQTVAIDVTLGTEGATVLAAQNRITYGHAAYVAAGEDGSPACAVNPAINKGATSFRFLPLGCDPVSECTAVRVVVLSFTNLAPIADGARLYTCQVVIAPGTAPGVYPLTNDEQLASDDLGMPLAATGDDGSVTVLPDGPAVAFHIGSAAIEAGSSAPVAVTLEALTAAGGAVVATSNEIAFEPETPVAAGAQGAPDCTLDAALNKDASFHFLPLGCTPGSNCTAVRAVIEDLFASGVIADMATLYTCSIAVASDVAPGSYALTLAMPEALDASSVALPATGTDGSVTVSAAPPPCGGDCDEGGTVGVNEILLAVNISLGNAPASACAAVDVDGSGTVAVNELILAVRNALSGCPAA